MQSPDSTTELPPIREEAIRQYYADAYAKGMPYYTYDDDSQAVGELLAEVKRLRDANEKLEARRQYGSDIINDMTLEADQQVKAELTLVGALAALPQSRLDGEIWYVRLDDLMATLQVHARHRGWADAEQEGGEGK